MTPAQKLKLKQVVEQNAKWPLAVIGATPSDFAKATVIPANIPDQDLWDLNFPMSDKLVIDGLDTLSEPEQEKFITLLKDRSGITNTLPEDTQIILTVKNRDALAQTIQRLLIFWEIK